MFYSQHILAKKGPLGTIWIAAHMDKKLRKSQIFETDIANSVDTILQPSVPLALRLSGQLLLGVVRIYSRQASFLHSDCSEALVKFKQVLRPDVINLPTEVHNVAHRELTLPDYSEDFDISTGSDLVTTFEYTAEKLSHGAREAITLEELPPADSFSSQISSEECFRIPEGDFMDMELEPEEPELLRDHSTPSAQNVMEEYSVGDIDLEMDESDKVEHKNPQEDEEQLQMLEEDALPPDPLERHGGLDNFQDAGELEPPPTLEEAATPILMDDHADHSLHQPAEPDGAALQTDSAREAPRPSIGFSTPSELPAHSPDDLNIELVDTPAGAAGPSEAPDISKETPEPATPVVPEARPAQEEAAAPREDAPLHLLRKRKLHVEDAIILSNDLIRTGLKDTSDIVMVRKKVRSEVVDWAWAVEAGPAFLTAGDLLDTLMRAPAALGPDSCMALRSAVERHCVVPTGFEAGPAGMLAAPAPRGRGRPPKEPKQPEEKQSTAELRAKAAQTRASRSAARSALNEAESPTINLNCEASEEEEEAPAETQAHDAGPSDAHGHMEVAALAEECGDRALDDQDLDEELIDLDLGADLADGEDLEDQAAANFAYDEEPETQEMIPDLMEEEEMEEEGAKVEEELDLVEEFDDEGHPEEDEDQAPSDPNNPKEGAWSVRTRSVMMFMKGQMQDQRTEHPDQDSSLLAYEILDGKGRKEAARFFFEMLLLNNKGYVRLKQSQPYSDIQ
eukprot:gene13969-16510_t